MIKPASYWALHKHSDPLTLGRVGVALAGRRDELNPPLNTTEALIVSMIEQDNKWHNERIDKQKEDWAKRQREKRARDKAKAEGKENITDVTVMSRRHRDNGDNHDVTIPPSLPSSTLSNESEYILRAREEGMRLKRRDVPDEKTVVTTATTVMGVNEAFAKWWYKEMVARDWTNTDGSMIGNHNWRPTLKAWFNRAKPEEIAAIETSAKAVRRNQITVKAEDWELCAERCGHFKCGECRAGHTTPPQLRARPIPPEECMHFEG